MKDVMQELINEILIDKKVKKTEIIYEYKKHSIEVVFVDGSNYEKHFKEEKITHKYLFDNKGNRHILLVKENSFHKYKNLYSSIVVLSTLRLFVNRKKRQIKLKVFVYSLLAFILIANIIIIVLNEFKKIFFIPIFSVLVGVLVFVYFSQIMTALYESDKKKTEELLLIKLPELEVERINDVYIK